MNISDNEILPSTFVERQNDKLKAQLHKEMVLDQVDEYQYLDIRLMSIISVP